MFYSIEQTRNYNKFQDVRIPSARNLYERYGAAVGKGVYNTSSDEISNPVHLSNNIIDNVAYAQDALSKSFDEINSSK